MKALRNTFRSFDSFGQPVTINFKGTDNFQTILGAVVSLAIQGFLMFFIYDGLSKLLTYQEAQVFQVSAFFYPSTLTYILL